MRILIDTNAYSELARGNEHVRLLVEQATEVLISAVVVGELHAGFVLGPRKLANIRRLDEFLKVAGVRVVPIDQSIAERYGDLVATLCKNGTLLPTNDIWIAATVLETASRLLSFDAHFDHIPGVMKVLT